MPLPLLVLAVEGGVALVGGAALFGHRSDGAAAPSSTGASSGAPLASQPSSSGASGGGNPAAKAGGIAAGVAAGAAVGAEVGELAVQGIKATGGTDSTQQAIVKGAAVAAGAAVGGAVAAGVAIGAAVTIAAPVAAGVALASGVISSVVNINRKADNDAKRAESIQTKGARATWADDFKTALAGLKDGKSATELIGYDDVDPVYSRRGYGGSGWAEHAISITDAFQLYTKIITLPDWKTGKPRGFRGYIDIDSTGKIAPHQVTVTEATNIMANEKAAELANNKAAALSGYGAGSASLIAATAAQAGTSTPTAAQITLATGIAPTGSKTDRVAQVGGIIAASRGVNLADL